MLILIRRPLLIVQLPLVPPATKDPIALGIEVAIGALRRPELVVRLLKLLLRGARLRLHSIIYFNIYLSQVGLVFLFKYI